MSIYNQAFRVAVYFCFMCSIWWNAAEPALPQELQKWHSKDGHTIDAMFFKLDEQQGTVTVLVPKVVPLDKLSAESLELARKMARGDAKPPTASSKPGTSTRKSNRAIKPGAAIDYKPLAFDPQKWTEKSIDTNLVPWEGERVVLLTTSPKFSPVVMTRFVERLDAGWETYEKLIGRSPNLFKHLNRKPTIAAIPDAGLTCGYGCGFIGSTGIEVAGFYQNDYALVNANPDAFAHYYFYEMGRNFYLFEDRHSLFITGYAVFMRYVCMDALNCQDPDVQTRAMIESCEQAFADSDISFLSGFTNLEDGRNEKAHRLTDRQGNPITPSDQPVIYAAAMLKLRRDYGGDDWVKKFFSVLMKCPPVKADTREGALKQSVNWLVAASAAAGQDLTPVFVQRWHMPLSQTTQDALARVDWKSAKTNPSALIGRLPIEFVPAP